jgi:hypothetical protein
MLQVAFTGVPAVLIILHPCPMVGCDLPDSVHNEVNFFIGHGRMKWISAPSRVYFRGQPACMSTNIWREAVSLTWSNIMPVSAGTGAAAAGLDAEAIVQQFNDHVIMGAPSDHKGYNPSRSADLTFEYLVTFSMDLKRSKMMLSNSFSLRPDAGCAHRLFSAAYT